MSNKRRRGAGIKLLIIFAAVLLLLLAGFGFLFDIKEILVSGAYDHSPEEIIEISGIETGKNLYFFNSKKAEKNIYDAFPYINFVTITRELPGTVKIEVSEGVVKAVIEHVYEKDDKEYSDLYIIDENCRVSEKLKEDGDYIEVIGLTATDVKRGSVITVDKEDETRLTFTQAVLNRLGDDGISVDVTWVDMTNISRITFDYKGRFTVNLGSAEKLEYKLSRLDGIVSQLKSTDKGVIDISEEGRAFFDPQ